MQVDGGLSTTMDTYLGGKLVVSGPITTTDTTASTSALTGAFVIPGGAGIGGDLNLASGKTINVPSGAATSQMSRLKIETSGVAAAIMEVKRNNAGVAMQVQG